MVNKHVNMLDVPSSKRHDILHDTNICWGILELCIFYVDYKNVKFKVFN